jgi:5'(3')-deoxyribonucleotidase
MKIGIDIDSTLNDLELAWCAWIRDVGGDPFWGIERHVSWDLHKLHPMGRHVFDFLRMRGSLRNLNPRPLAQQVTAELAAAGHELFAVSSNVHAENWVEKCEWLDEHFPVIDPKHRVSTYNKGIMRLDVLIDDGPHNFMGFDGRCLLFDQPWNRSDEAMATSGQPGRLRRVIDWMEIKKVLL